MDREVMRVYDKYKKGRVLNQTLQEWGCLLSPGLPGTSVLCQVSLISFYGIGNGEAAVLLKINRYCSYTGKILYFHIHRHSLHTFFQVRYDMGLNIHLYNFVTSLCE